MNLCAFTDYIALMSVFINRKGVYSMSKKTMKASVIQRVNDLSVLDIPIPEIGDDQVLAKVAYCGICATDYDNYTGVSSFSQNGGIKFPLRWGHEWSGRICAVGKDVKDLKVGDRILGDGKVTCGYCEKCVSGQWYDCINKLSVGTVGDIWPGAMAEYMLMPARNTIKLGDNISFTEAAAMESSTIAMNGFRDLPVKDNTVLIIGSGPIGLSGVAIAKALKAKKIIVAARKKAKLDIAVELGADEIINVTEKDVYEELSRLTNGTLANVVLETSGQAQYVENLVKLTAYQGYFSMVGFFDRPIHNLDMDEIVYLKISMFGRAGSHGCAPELEKMIDTGVVNIKPIITNQIDFYKDGDRCMDIYAAEKGTCVKMLVKIFGEDA